MKTLQLVIQLVVCTASYFPAFFHVQESKQVPVNDYSHTIVKTNSVQPYFWLAFTNKNFSVRSR